MLRFPALNSRTTPEEWGTIQTFSANVVRDADTGLVYPGAEVEIDNGLNATALELVRGFQRSDPVLVIGGDSHSPTIQ